jgi:aminopeptidase N
VVTYADRPARHSYAGERNWLASKREVVTMNEPHMAPWWFPANDHPLDKAVVDVRIRVPKGREVISNGELKGTKVGRTSTTWHWRADEPMVPYLAFFAAGDFTIARGTHRGLPWLVAVSQALSPRDQRASMRLMRRTPKVVAGLEKDLGSYPFSVTGGITTALDPGFALENQTRPTYPAVGSAYTSLVVHELAHQWFGDDIAVAGWRDIWLNEGFASFMEWRWTETHGGRSANAVLRSYYDNVAATSDFWQVTVADPGPAKVFDAAIYGRGAMTLQALRNRVGDDAFWKILRTWIREQRGGNGASEEFEAVAARVSGQDLTSFFTAWLRTPSKPAETPENGLS